MRSSVSVRRATPADLSVLLELWIQAWDNWRPGDRGRLVEAPAVVASRLEDLLGGSDVRVLLAVAGAEPAGMAILAPLPLGPLSEQPALHMSYTVVSSQHRRRGVGRALVAAATAYADDLGLTSVTVDVPPGLREAHRFYARLGFAPVVTRRAAPVSALRRRLAVSTRRPLVDDLVRRRSRHAPVPALRLGLAAERRPSA